MLTIAERLMQQSNKSVLEAKVGFGAAMKLVSNILDIANSAKPVTHSGKDNTIQDIITFAEDLMSELKRLEKNSRK